MISRIVLGASCRRMISTTLAETVTLASIITAIDDAEAHLSRARPLIARSAPRLVELSRQFNNNCEDGDCDDRANVWASPEQAALLARELAVLSSRQGSLEELELRIKHTAELCSLVTSEEDNEILPELSDEIMQIVVRARELSQEVLLSDPEDHVDECFMEIYAGAGGEDAQSFAEMLVGMYIKWAAATSSSSTSCSYAVHVDDWNPATDVGIRSARLRCTGPCVFGWLAGEAGVQRLVRISPFDASGRRHTSFARVLVFPSVVTANENDGRSSGNMETITGTAVDALLADPAVLRIDTFRASGKGGQSVNTTDSAVRMTHLPTGIVASYQGERSQHHNRKRCMGVMRAKLAAHIAAENTAKRDEHWRDVLTVENAFGGQFRSYTLDTGIVNDHRTGFKCSGAEQVLMDGRIGPLLEAGLQHRKEN